LNTHGATPRENAASLALTTLGNCRFKAFLEILK